MGDGRTGEGGTERLWYLLRVLVREGGLEPPRGIAPPDPKSGASTNSATPASLVKFKIYTRIFNGCLSFKRHEKFRIFSSLSWHNFCIFIKQQEKLVPYRPKLAFLRKKGSYL